MFTSKERVERVLLHQKVDYVPFTVYTSMIPQCEIERKLRNQGLCILHRVDTFKRINPEIKIKTIHYDEDDKTKIRTDIETPYGNLFNVSVVQEIDTPTGQTSIEKVKMFKNKEDYKKIEFMIHNRKYLPDYEPILKAEKMTGGDIIFRSGIGSLPFHEIIVSIMGIETFSIEWAENRDEVLKLYQALVEDKRKIYPIVAQSPVLHVNYGGNIISDVVGKERFEKYTLPDYEEASGVMHKYGKLIGTHLDGNNKLIAPLVAKSSLDYIEAFTPFPDTDMNVKEALDIWPNKILWINFPSSVHLQKEEKIRETTVDILKQAKPGDRLIVGITEDVPNEHWQKSFSVILDTLNTYGKIPIQ